MDLKIGSLNVRGLGDKAKRRETFHWLRSKKMSIFFLQEVHCTEDNKHDWRAAENGDIKRYLAVAQAKVQVLPFSSTIIVTFKFLKSIQTPRDAL